MADQNTKQTMARVYIFISEWLTNEEFYNTNTAKTYTFRGGVILGVA
jgi:hypothetical protein